MIQIDAAGDVAQLRPVYKAKSKNSVCHDKVAQLPVKPEWLTREQIDEYAARMGVK